MNLIELVEAGDVAGVLTELDALTAEERALPGAEVDAMAARSGSSQMVKQARLLRDVLR